MKRRLLSTKTRTNLEHRLKPLKPYYRPLAIIFAFAIIGATFLVASRAATPSAGVEAEKGTLTSNAASGTDNNASGGGYVRFGSGNQANAVRRFFADDASWNKTIAEMGGELTQLRSYGPKLWDYGGGTASGAPAGEFYLQIKDYSVPIYDIKEANTTIRLYQAVWAQNQQKMSSTIAIGEAIPWNHNWKPGTGVDAIMAIVNYDTGKVYEIWRAAEPILGCFDIFGTNAQNGFNADESSQKCIAGVETYDNLWTAKEGTTLIGRGMGINKLALTVRAEEVRTGNIRHAIPLTTSNPMFGPMVSPAYDPFQPGAGTTKGFYMKPATRLEHTNASTLALGGTTTTPHTDEERAKTIPSGMRFGIRINENDITNWLNQKGYTGAKRQTATTFARALRDYGAIVAETGGWGIGIETDGIIGPAKPIWEELGLYDSKTDTTSNIDFRGLITRDNIYVVKPPN